MQRGVRLGVADTPLAAAVPTGGSGDRDRDSTRSGMAAGGVNVVVVAVVAVVMPVVVAVVMPVVVAVVMPVVVVVTVVMASYVLVG